MGSISTGVGLISGINSAQLIEQLLALEAQSKSTLTSRVSTLQTKRTALLDVNSRLLALKSASTAFRVNKVFKSAIATSSSDEVATATADTTTPVGNYQFFVKRLASSSQIRSKGFATLDATPLGLSSLKLEFGDIGVSRSTDLASLNGGDGVRRGKIVITDKSGDSATVDLSKATTLQEVVEEINASNDIAVTASIDNERLVLSDTSGGGGNLSVANGSGDFTATDLGIVGSTATSTLTSTQINKLGVNTTLASLNDGLGVFIRDDAVDFTINIGGTDYDISLGRENLPITGATELASLNNGTGVKINTTDAADFVVKASNGTSVSINLGAVLEADGTVDEPAVTTVQEMLNRVNETLADEFGSNKVVLSINGTGTGFVLTDTIGGGETLRVLGAGPSGDEAAKDLGIFTGATGTGPSITGSTIINEVKTPRASTIQDVIDRISEATHGVITAKINSAGTGLELDSGGLAFTVTAGDVDGSSQATAVAERTARDLGILGLTEASSTGRRVLSGVGTVLARNIAGGVGLGSTTNTLTLTDRTGAQVTVNNLDSYTTLEQLVDAVNSAATSGLVGVSLAVSSNNNSLVVTDTTAGTGSLTVAGSAASLLGISGTGNSSGVLKGANLEIKYISEAQSVSSLNYGRGIGTGSFKLTDSTGESSTVEIDSDSTTLYDVIREINSRGLEIEARLNTTGDGILLVDTAATPTSKMKVADVSGTVAKSLGIVGEADNNGDDIDGSYEKSIDVASTDTLKKIISKINAAGVPLTATVVNTGSGATPYYLTLSSSISGRGGSIQIDTGAVDLSFTTLSAGQDAEILFGNSDAAKGLVLRSSDNVFEDVVTGLDVTTKVASNDLVTIDVKRDVEGINKRVTDWVDAFNVIVDKLNAYDSYNPETEKRGILLGDPTLARARTVLYNTVQGKAKNVDGSYQFLSQVGITVGKGGKLVVDQAKFDAAYAADPDSVESLFATLKQEKVSPTATLPGITIGEAKTVSTALGFGDLFDQALANLTSTVGGAFTRANESFGSQIDRVNSRITLFDDRLQTRRERLQAQFAAMEDALAKLSTQQSSLSSITSLIG